MSDYKQPPPTWVNFGEHLVHHGILEFSTERGEDGLPLWERVDIEEVRREALRTYVRVARRNPSTATWSAEDVFNDILNWAYEGENNG